MTIEFLSVAAHPTEQQWLLPKESCAWFMSCAIFVYYYYYFLLVSLWHPFTFNLAIVLTFPFPFFFLSQQDVEDPRTESLREYCYGLMLPIICSLGIIGNVLNLIVLTRRNMRGTAYIYMRGKSASHFSIHLNSNFNSIDCLHWTIAQFGVLRGCVSIDWKHEPII